MSTICPSCGYPVISSMHTCPNCNAVVADKDHNLIRCPHCGEMVSGDEDFCPQCGNSLWSTAVSDAGASVPDEQPLGEVIPVCTLRPISYAGERGLSQRTYEDKGDGVILARGNTFPGEQSISEAEQAVLFFHEGDWYIEEAREDCRSTFVHAGKAIKLSPGDVIRMGDREFEFNIKVK